MPYDEFQSLPSWWDFAAMAHEGSVDPYAITEPGYEPMAEEIAALESYEADYNAAGHDLYSPWEHTPYA